SYVDVDLTHLDPASAPQRHSQQLGEEPLIVDDEHPRPGLRSDSHDPVASPRSSPRTPAARAATTAASNTPRWAACWRICTAASPDVAGRSGRAIRSAS